MLLENVDHVDVWQLEGAEPCCMSVITILSNCVPVPNPLLLKHTPVGIQYFTIGFACLLQQRLP
jgi:hypothetical protein